jgi:HlyD family secretion protein
MKATEPNPEQHAAEPSPEAKLLESKHTGQPTEPKPEDKTPPPKADTKTAPNPVEPKPEVKTARAKTDFRNKIIIGLSIIGIVAGLVAAYYFGLERKAQPPVFKPVSSPYESAIYANGIIESDQPSGSNINIYPEISGPVIQVLVHEGQLVSAGTPLLAIDDSVQKAITAELGLQAEASLALLNELKAQPRKETLAIAEAQVGLAEANLKVARNQYEKRRASFDIDPKSISKDVLDTADDAVTQATAGLDVARKQFELTKAGAWNYDLVSQQKQYDALKQAYQAANALLQKYSVKAQVNGVILALNTTVGSTISPQGAYNAYTQGFDPLLVMSAPQDYLAVRCYIDEILVSRLPSTWHIRAEMSVRGTDIKVPLEFVRVQPYVSPKIELSNQRQEKVDLRVLPVIFRFPKQDAPVYPGQLVDVYIGQK